LPDLLVEEGADMQKKPKDRDNENVIYDRPESLHRLGEVRRTDEGSTALRTIAGIEKAPLL
jgi:hypothetical protein